MRKIAKLLALACLAVASPAYATNGMRMIGFGPVQDSMGGVGAAAPLDAATIVSNPAGLSALERRADLALTYFSPSVKYDAQSASPSQPIASGATIDSDRGASYIPTLGLVWPTGGPLTLGVAALGVSGMGVDYAKDLYGGKTVTSYANLRVAPAASWKIAKGLAAGAAVNLMYATMKYEVAGGMGMLPRDTKGAFGFGATVGLQWTPIDMVTVGLAYESKSFFRDFEWTIPSHQVATSSGMVTVPGGTEKLSFDQPQVVTAGGAVRPVEGLLLALDVQWIGWSSTNGKDQPEFATNPQLTGAKAWNMNWSDQLVLKVGGEYAATKALKIRAGYDYGKMPLDAARAFENIAFPAIAEHHVTLGAGYTQGPVTVNAAAVYSPEATITGGNAAEQGIGSYSTKMSQLAFDLGVAYRF